MVTNKETAYHAESVPVEAPNTSTKLTWQELWDSKRVLAWCTTLLTAASIQLECH